MGLSVFDSTAKERQVCGKGVMHRSCPVPPGTTFSVDVGTDAGPPQGFQGYQTILQYSGDIALVQQPGLEEDAWPRCVGNGFEQHTAQAAGAPGRYVLGCDAGAPSQTYSGALSNVHFSCKGSGAGLVSIVGGAGAMTSFYHRPSVQGNRIFLMGDGSAGQVLADAVVIDCGAGADPGDAGGIDSDGDGCSDAREAGSNARAGGRRDRLNPWDFFDPTGDGKHRVDDVLSVISRFFTNAGEARYAPSADRTALGPDYWNLGAPDGRVRIDDVAAAARLFFHDC
jgi:hypothetical protein